MRYLGVIRLCFTFGLDWCHSFTVGMRACANLFQSAAAPFNRSQSDDGSTISTDVKLNYSQLLMRKTTHSYLLAATRFGHAITCCSTEMAGIQVHVRALVTKLFVSRLLMGFSMLVSCSGVATRWAMRGHAFEGVQL